MTDDNRQNPANPDQPQEPEDTRSFMERFKEERNRLLAKSWGETFSKWSSEKQDGRTEAEAQRIIGESDIDREAAELFLKHHEHSRDEALDNRDFPAAARAADETASHREAARILRKPKNHQERLDFERKQADDASKDGGFQR